jgi:uncharacterized coiled-coil DUF342 family protein
MDEYIEIEKAKWEELNENADELRETISELKEIIEEKNDRISDLETIIRNVHHEIQSEI